jgi:hypothetical protein
MSQALCRPVLNLLPGAGDQPSRRQKQGAVMMKTTTAIMVAAAIAATVTVLSAPTGHVDASPLAKAEAAPMAACVQQAWPYLHCVGTTYGNPHIRLVTFERLWN